VLPTLPGRLRGRITGPITFDLQLFGLVQMCASIPGPSLAVLGEDSSLQRLREWTETMQRRFAEFPHLHSARRVRKRRLLRS
jgi:hypothetical protein